ncbi:transcriptional regulator [Kosakonia cowanii]|jgi:DNA-binding HxlR family transcriptional regulator|uniref:winged helix-turn-helix transcriptional regulator n=1 Tax=Kosakonia cowanii TaxID=208223 RepID=UPI000FEC9FA7|nr:helix-turn-helix domain-containing protein [Kosakonia cowanii]MDP9768033.1 DNA-binding HxlR family transcriptional regulator [Atlantibacter hermannii]QAR46661.1 transcriptional regulator [Kosakonia cowanii]TNL13264.1 transcriptional regulator [Kosakonia cowanii]TPD69323.1 helix-turn-helix transcriptional regulator [Kosakonia cowanii]TPD92360.1 helix-turn-helix transcriptional regulator [Kosakonia cowanii]
MNMPARSDITSCEEASEVLSHIGDKWTVLVVVALKEKPRRFNEIKRYLRGISHQMLTRTLKNLLRDGMVDRKVFDTVPPQVEYRLSELGQSLSQVLKGLADWAQNNSKTILLSRSTYDAKNGE